ncbi:hypothetical protein [Streptomyces sp. NBC_01304]|uniref:hypothetical protein n=1 Tax=Streptomyces sp. NBC_01304 TaxID=2903818 RepID=UPI002E0E173A|nr:hypothetical protein OG430_01815 [Streptomyces sp. NBC_01304]
MSAPIVVHPPQGTGGRRVTVRGQILGLAHDDNDLLEFLRRAGLPDAETLLESGKRLTDAFGASGVEGYVGTVHAADVDAAGEPDPQTLCGRVTDNLTRVRGDNVAASFETWYSWNPEVQTVCRDCNESATR